LIPDNKLPMTISQLNAKIKAKKKKETSLESDSEEPKS
jgi:hypothetical protein